MGRKDLAVLAIIFAVMVGSPDAAAGNTDPRLATAKESPVLKTATSEQRIYAHQYYEEFWVTQGSRKGSWRHFSTRVAILKENIPFPYVDFTRHSRMGITDETIEFGGYANLDNGFLHVGAGYGGFGADRDYIYRFMVTGELERRIAGGFSANIDTRYLHFPEGDVCIFRPGIVYYLGDSYILARYGVSIAEKRDPAQFVMIQGNLNAARYLNLYFGGAVGERLYDIFLFGSSEQLGYTVFGGVDIMISGNISLRIGGSYSEEGKDFFKRGLESRIALRF